MHKQLDISKNASFHDFTFEFSTEEQSYKPQRFLTRLMHRRLLD